MRNFAWLILMLAACNRGPEVPTATENHDLDAASEMLDNADDNLSGIDENGVLPEPPPAPM